MALSPQFLDEIRDRTILSALIARTVKLDKAGRELKGCCPFHQEKTPSFTVNDEKGFYHCFGCGAHGDAIRWLTDARGLAFIDAVKELAAAAGIEMPARSADVEAREAATIATADVLETAARWYAEQLPGDKKAKAAIDARGIGSEAIVRFGLGFAPAKRSVASCGIKPDVLVSAGLMIEDESTGLYRDRFRQRIMIPIRDGRGRVRGFAGRIVGEGTPKYLNSPESPHFAKGDLLFNLDRAAAAARQTRRLLIVEGQIDAIALDQIGIEDATAPMGTALTERQLERAWRVAYCPILLLDGDEPGRKAALRAAERALPLVGPGRSLAFAMLPAGEDPDSLARGGSAEEGRAAIEAVIAGAKPLSAWLWDALKAEADEETPEGRAALWARLERLGGTVRDPETRAQYLADWRARFDKSFPPAPPGLFHEDILPDGKIDDISRLGEGERARLRSVEAAWAERETARACRRIEAAKPEEAPAIAGRFAWEIGRRFTTGLIDAEETEGAFRAVRRALGEACPEADEGDYERSFEIGKKRTFDFGPMLLDMRCALLHRTDKGNAERWHLRFGEDYLYTTAKGWLGWDERRYRVLNQEKDTTPSEVLASVFGMIEAIRREADFVRDTGWPDDEEIDPDLFAELEEDPRRPGGMDRIVSDGKRQMRLSAKLAAWALASEASGRIGCIAGLVKRWVTVDLTTFDTEGMVLNCLNGTVHFFRPEGDRPARWELKPHDRADRLTKITACNFDPEARAPQFLKLVRWAQPDKARHRYLRQWLGYNLTGDVGEQIFHIWYGPLAANGKSTVGNACRDAIGDYGDAGKVETFLSTGAQRSGDAATPALVRLPGVRMVTAGEPQSGVSIDEALINGLTGGDPLLVRDNFRSFFRFLPSFKFTLWCNELPPIPHGTAGIWRRVKVMLWEQHLEEHERDRELPGKLTGEYDGILAWMVRGLLDWLDNGFVEPESVQLASAEYKQDSDPLTTFLRTCTVIDPEGRVQSSLLHETYVAWAKAAGEVEWKQKTFSLKLKAKGLVSKASNGIHWLGLRLTREPTDFVDSEGRVRNVDAGDGALPVDTSPPPHPQWDDDEP